MSIRSLSNHLISIDNSYLDYIPIVSTPRNLYFLFKKCTLSEKSAAKDLKTAHTYKHLKDHSYLRYMSLSVPIFGNVILFIYDRVNQRLANRSYALAICYEKGKGVEKDVKKAAALYQKAADRGHIDAMYRLAYYYAKGKGVKKNIDMAASLCQKAADKGLLDATDSLYDLAVSYENGKDVKQDPKKALALYQQAMDKEHVEATFYLAVCYEKGRLVEKQDLKKAIALYQKGHDKGHLNSTYNLAVCYEKGLGTPENMKEAIILYKQGSDKGHAPSMFNLAVCYMKGLGDIEAFQETALNLIQKAAAKNLPAAFFALAFFNESGRYVPQNKEEAIRLYKLADERGDARAKVALERLQPKVETTI